MTETAEMKRREMPHRAQIVLRAIVAVAISLSVLQPVAAQQAGGRKQNEFRIPVRRTAPQIPVHLVARAEGVRPAVPPSAPISSPVWGASLQSQRAGYDGPASRPGPEQAASSAVGPLQAAPRRLPQIRMVGGAAGSASPASSWQQPAATSREMVTSPQPGLSLTSEPAGSSAAPHQQRPAATLAGLPTRAAASTDYRLGAGDVVDIFVWRNPDLSRQVPVRPDGRISLPLMGDLLATGRTAGELQAEITRGLSEYVQMPTVSVTVSEIRSNVVYVLGNVKNPGPVDMIGSLTILQAVAMSGGLNEFADRNEIAVLRTDSYGQPQRWSFHYDDVVKGEDLSTNVLLQAGDVIYVP